MRVSVDKNDPGYREDVLSGRYKVYLNEQEVSYCITADEEAGEIVRYKSVDGYLYTTGDGNLPRETLKGNVKIVKG